MKFALLLIIFLSHFSAFAITRILIDPGHGGTDGGAKYNGVSEAKLVLDISKELASIFSKDPEFKVEMTRTTDATVSLNSRVEMFKNHDYLLSLHANSSLDSRARGLEVFIMTDEASYAEEQTLPSKENDINRIKTDLLRSAQLKNSVDLGKNIVSEWKAPLFKTPARTLKQENFYVLQNSIQNTAKSAVLIELGFLSQSDDSKLLSNKKWQKQRAQEIYRAVRKHVEAAQTH